MSVAVEIRPVEDERDLNASFSVMKELRPALIDPVMYAAQVIQQRVEGYRLLAAWRNNAIVGLVGYRLQLNLIYGRFVYVDDLVVTGSLQRSTIGERLLRAARQQAIASQCRHFVLDTGLHMSLAQRFYFRQGLLARGMHFVEPLHNESTPRPAF